ncbi:MAG: IPTL-CTERM sorting domain-containing protein [Bacteroidota bacterium]
MYALTSPGNSLYSTIYSIDAIGFLVLAAGTTSQTGNFKVYLKNTSDVTYTLGATWTTAGFTLVGDIASWTVPIASGAYMVNFSGGSSFTYAGGGVYVAWEFSNAGTTGTGAHVANCNTNLVNGLYGNRSATSLPTSLSASDFRPATQFANNAFNDVYRVANVYAQEKCPVPVGVPTGISARVGNASNSAATFNVTLTITDQATSAVRYTNTQAVTSLAAGGSEVVSFAPWTAAILENDLFTVSIPAGSGENFTLNNTMSIPVNVNNNLFGYCYSQDPATGYGSTYTGAGGIFASKFHMNGTGTVTGANLFIYNYAANAGNTVNAVVLNRSGVITGQSASLVIAPGDLGTNKNFTFPTPVSITDEDFYIGLAQPSGGAAQWYPMGCMTEAPYRANTFYSFGITGGTPSIQGVDYKFMIEAVVAPVNQAVPTLSEWALIIMGMLLFGTGVFYIARRRKTA